MTTYQVQEGNFINEYAIEEIKRERLLELRHEIANIYGRVERKTFTSSIIPGETPQMRNMRILPQYASGSYKIEADYVLVPRIVELIDGVLSNDERALRELMKYDGKNNPLVSSEIAEELDAISNALKTSNSGSIETLKSRFKQVSAKLEACESMSIVYFSEIIQCFSFILIGQKPVVGQDDRALHLI